MMKQDEILMEKMLKIWIKNQKTVKIFLRW